MRVCTSRRRFRERPTCLTPQTTTTAKKKNDSVNQTTPTQREVPTRNRSTPTNLPWPTAQRATTTNQQREGRTFLLTNVPRPAYSSAPSLRHTAFTNEQTHQERTTTKEGIDHRPALHSTPQKSTPLHRNPLHSTEIHSTPLHFLFHSTSYSTPLLIPLHSTINHQPPTTNHQPPTTNHQPTNHPKP